MPDTTSMLSRRQMLGVAATATALATPDVFAAEPKRPTYCAFIKFLQSLSHAELAKQIKSQGFAGIEATVRPNGQVEPEQVAGGLPPLVEALNAEGLEITVMASNVNRADDAVSERVLRTAAKLGVKRYRMRYYRYNANQPIAAQLANLKPVVRDLAQLNAELGLQAVYQNHSGSANVGAAIWDLAELFENIDPTQMAVAFDIRHATVEGGLSWPTDFRRIQPHLGAVYVKDFIWDRETRRPKNVPLGKGLVDPRFFKQLKQMNYDGVVSLHVEYLGKAGVAPNLKAMRDDFATLRRLMT